jgi:thymidylate synthase
MKVWQDILKTVLENGEKRNDRTGCGTLALFNKVIEFDNEFSFPAVTTKKLAFKSMASELACFIHGKSKLSDFHKFNCKIWDANGNADYWLKNTNNIDPGNYLGRIYGVNWRGWKSVNTTKETLEIKETDQLHDLVQAIKKEPHSRRHVVLAFNPGELDQTVLPACHLGFQVFVRGSTHIDIAVQMRSVDLFLGLPFDVASYALLQRLIAKEVGLTSGKLYFNLGDTHIYLNHIEQVKTILTRTPHTPPQLKLSDDASLFDFHPSQAELVSYESYGILAAPMSV